MAIDVRGMAPLLQVFDMPKSIAFLSRCVRVHTYSYLRDKGIQLEPPKIAPYGMKQLYVNDPDGYSVCFQWPAVKKG